MDSGNQLEKKDYYIWNGICIWRIENHIPHFDWIPDPSSQIIYECTIQIINLFFRHESNVYYTY